MKMVENNKRKIPFPMLLSVNPQIPRAMINPARINLIFL